MTDSFGPLPSSISTRNAISPAPSSAQPVLKPVSAEPAPVQPAVQPAVVRPVQPAVARGAVRPVVPPAQPILGPKTRDLIELSKSLRVQQPQKAEPKAPLGELAALAETLNSESDELNATIQTINTKLRALNFGVEVWCKEIDSVAFGFCRIGDPSEWQLAARSISLEFNNGKKEYSYAPLLKRNRNERIQGLEFVPEILGKLKEDAEHKVAAIRKAKQLAASL